MGRALAALACLGWLTCAAAQGGDARQALREAQLALLPVVLSELPQVPLGSQSFVYPLRGTLSSGFGWRDVSVNGNRYHAGVDWAAPTGTPVRAARDGVVVRAGWWSTYGNAVAIDHGDGSETRYAHLSAVHVRAGDVVRQGDVVGLVGSTGASTGPHLHFELRFGAQAVDPLGYLEEPREAAAR
ncbi:MAG TPA: M23 family metallopeptidase [Trueperaceae bacterium]|nr:M23 family metallopeptidase [Trueperaceae bacterium]